MSFSIVHLADPHFGGGAVVEQVEALEALVPDLEPDLIVLSGDLTQRARHGEFQRARSWIRELERTAPVYVLPGNHDVQWWWRPFVPFARAVIWEKYRRYISSELTPTLELPGAIVAGVLTSYGVAWGSLTPRLRDIAVKGHLPKREVERAARIFGRARPAQLRVLVMHHNLLRGELSGRMGLARWRQAQRRITEIGPDLVLCGHDHQESAELLGSVVVAATGTLTNRSRGGRPSTFNRIVVDEEATQVECYRWEAARKVFKRSDRHQFARQPPRPETAEQAGDPRAPRDGMTSQPDPR